MSVAHDPQHDTQLITGIRVGLRKARELGYEVETMDVTASVSEGVCDLHFAPIPSPGFITVGGDLSLKVDAGTGDVIDFQRGQ